MKLKEMQVHVHFGNFIGTGELGCSQTKNICGNLGRWVKFQRKCFGAVSYCERGAGQSRRGPQTFLFFFSCLTQYEISPTSSSSFLMTTVPGILEALSTGPRRAARKSTSCPRTNQLTSTWRRFRG